MSNSKKSKRLLSIVMVLIPFVLAVIYYAFIATNRYVSTAEVAVRQTDSTNPSTNAPGLALLLGSVNPTSREETLYLRQYIISNDMLEVLKRDINWLEHYSSVKRDPLYWLSSDAPQSELLAFYQRVVQVHFDSETGLLKIEVQAFDPAYSKQVLSLILQESERFVNELSHKMTRDQLTFVEQELATARANYELKRDELLQFQAQNNLLDAEATATSRSAMIASMESELASEKAKLAALSASLSPNAPQVRQQRSKIQAIEQQLISETQRLIAQEGSNRLNTVAAKFRDLTIQAGIAEEAYKVSLASLENTRIEVNKKFRTLAVVVSPNLPEDAIYPNRFYNLITILVGLLALMGITRFILATIEDHRD